MNQWTTYNPKEKQSYSKAAFDKMLAHSKQQNLNPWVADYTIGLKEDSWLGKNGFSTFQGMTGLVVSPYYQFLRRDESMEYSRENVTPKLFPKVRIKVAEDVRELLASTDDCKKVAELLAGTPSPDGNPWSAWSVRTFALENHCFRKKELL